MTPTNCVNARYLRRELGVQHGRGAAWGDGGRAPDSLDRWKEGEEEAADRDQSSPWKSRKMVLRNQRWPASA
jgi:hypothetical protein